MVAAPTFAEIRNSFLAFFAIFCSLFLLSSAALAQTNLTAQVEDVPAQLNYNADGSVTVSFKGSAGTVYQVFYSDSAAASPDTMNWKLAADNLTAETAAWTTWVDKGDAGRSSPAEVQQRYYRVVTKGLLLGDTPPPLSPSSTTFTGLTKSLRLARLQEAGIQVILTGRSPDRQQTARSLESLDASWFPKMDPVAAAEALPRLLPIEGDAVDIRCTAWEKKGVVRRLLVNLRKESYFAKIDGTSLKFSPGEVYVLEDEAQRK